MKKFMEMVNKCKRNKDCHYFYNEDYETHEIIFNDFVGYDEEDDYIYREFTDGELVQQICDYLVENATYPEGEDNVAICQLDGERVHIMFQSDIS